MAVTKPKGSGAETPTSEPGYSATDALWDADWDDAEELFVYRHQRRLSDPSANLNNFVRGGWRTKPDAVATKARSENEGLDSMANCLNEIEAGDVRDAKGHDVSGWGRRGPSPASDSPQTTSPHSLGSPQSSSGIMRRENRRARSTSETCPSSTTRTTMTAPTITATTTATLTRANNDNRQSTKLRSNKKEEKINHETSTRLGGGGDCQRTTTSQPSASPKSHQRHRRQQHHIEVGSEITSNGSCPSDDNVMQKLDAGAILVNGKEELPLGYSTTGTGVDNARKVPSRNNDKNPEISKDECETRGIPITDKNAVSSPLSRRRRPRHRPRRYFSDDEIIGVHSSRKNRDELVDTCPRSDQFLLENGTNHHDDTEIPHDNDNLPKNSRLDETTRDKNANSRLTRASTYDYGQRQSATLPRRRRRRAMSGSIIRNRLPPHRVTPDGTAIYYWCELPRHPGSQELDDGQYNPLWTMRGFTQTFHFWKETRRAQSVPLNAFLTYITLPWWSIAKDILDHREDPILTF